MRAKMRKSLTEKLRPLRPQIERRIQSIAQEETEGARIEQQQMHVISEYVGVAQSSLHVNGKLPFEYPGLKGYQSLDALDQSLEQIKKD